MVPASILSWLPFFDRRRGRLVRHYFLVFMVLIGGGMIASGFLEIYFRYYETRKLIGDMQAQIADEAMVRIADYFLQIEQQLKTALTTREIADKGLSGDHKFELMKLLSLVPAISEVIAIDHAGIPQLHISRFRAILPGEELNYSQKASFLQAKQGVTYFSPVYFVGNTEPFITIAVAIERFPGSVIGVLQAETNLRYIGDVVKDIKVGKAGYAYIATRSGDVIAHPDNSLVLQRRNVSDLDQLKAALRPTPTILKPETLTTRGLNGDHVLTSYAFLPSLDWAVILERPLAEAYEPLYGSLFRNSSLLLIGLGIALVASFFVVRRVVRPLEALRRGVERIGKGDLNYRLDIKTGDEIELLAEQFNNMAGELKDSYQILENKVKQRTEELSALFDITTAASQSLEINDVLAEVTKKIKETFHFDTTRIFLFTSSADELHLRAKFGDALEGREVYPTGRGLLARATQGGEPIFFENIQIDEQYAELSHSHANKQAGYKALGYFPIRVAGTSLGCVVYNGRQARKLTADEIRLLRSMCDQIGVAINNINLFEEVREKTAQQVATNLELLESLDQQTRIGEVLRAMARSPSNLQALLDAMIMNAVTLAHANAGVIRLHDDAGMFPFVAYHRDNGPGLPNLLSRSLRIDEDSASTRSLRERKAVQILDIRNEGPHFRGPIDEGPTRTVLAVPVIRQDVAIGTIVVLRDIVEPFTDRQIEMVTTFADQAVIAMENIHLFQEVQNRGNDLARLVKKLEGLSEVGQAVSSTLDLQTVLTSIVSHAVALSGADVGVLCEFREQDPKFLIQASYQLTDELIQVIEDSGFPFEQTVMGRAVSSRQPVQVPDILTDGNYSLVEMVHGMGVRSILGVPLMRDNTVLGVLVVGSKAPGEFPQETVDLLQTFSSQSVLTIQNARLFRDIKEQREELELANQRLKELDKLKSDFVSNLSHELRTPLTAVEVLIDNMLDGITGPLNDKQGRYIVGIKDSADRLARLIDDLLDLSVIEAGRLELRQGPFSPAILIHAVTDTLRPMAEEKFIRLEAGAGGIDADLWHGPTGTRSHRF